VLSWGAYLAIFWLALEISSSREIRRGFRKALVYFGFTLSHVLNFSPRR
jgi:hypothetical protein